MYIICSLVFIDFAHQPYDCPFVLSFSLTASPLGGNPNECPINLRIYAHLPAKCPPIERIQGLFCGCITRVTFFVWNQPPRLTTKDPLNPNRNSNALWTASLFISDKQSCFPTSGGLAFPWPSYDLNKPSTLSQNAIEIHWSLVFGILINLN